MRECRTNLPGGRGKRTERGASILEIVIVASIAVILGAIALPQLIAERQLHRMAGINREILTQLRFARQHSMSQRKAVTFTVDTTNKQLIIILHNDPGPDGIANTSDDIKSGKAVINSTGYPLTNGYSTVRTIPLTGYGVPPADIVFGTQTPGSPAVPTTLGDGTSMTAASNNKINITFQPDGSVVDGNGAYRDAAIFMYNAQKPTSTSSAVSVLGAAGRVKLWKYNSGTNAYDE